MQISLIIAVYKDTQALELIFKSLLYQIYNKFEVIVAEDGRSEIVHNCVINARKKYKFNILHTTQNDNGIRKMRSLNNAIIASSYDYLVFIDGDCILYSTFLQGHYFLAENNYIISGRRCNLGKKFSTMLRNKDIKSIDIENNFFKLFFKLNIDNKERHTEAGIYINPQGIFYNIFLKNRQPNTQLLGCNYSCFKKDIIAINGYDEGYGQTAIGDDTDMQWRFEALGLKIKSAKNIANQFHLHHTRNFRDNISYKDEKKLFLQNKKENKFICTYGLNTH